MTIRNTAIAATVLVVFGLVVFDATHRGGDGQSPETKRMGDSLVLTQPQFDSTSLSLARVDTHFVAADSQLAHAARASLRRANAEHARADSVALVAATATDSLAKWHEAYDARTAETVDLRTTIDTLNTRIDTLRADTDSLRRGWTEEKDRRDAVERFNKGLAADIEKQRCQVLPGVRCPTRKETVVLVTVLHVLLRASTR